MAENRLSLRNLSTSRDRFIVVAEYVPLPGHRLTNFETFLKGYAENGGTCLQVNMLDPDMLRDAQQHPENYPHLLVRITGYNAYFTAIGKELQNEVIERVSHQGY